MSDIAIFSQYAQAQVAADVSMKVAVKAKTVAQDQGAAVILLLESAAQVAQSMSIEPGKGQRLDVTG